MTIDHPYAKLVEALRTNNGFYFSDCGWRCVTCGFGYIDNKPPKVSQHNHHCPVCLALEHKEPTMTDPHNIEPSPPPALPKLTPLEYYRPEGETVEEWRKRMSDWVDANLRPLESIQRIIDAQAEPSSAPGPKVGDVVTYKMAKDGFFDSLPLGSRVDKWCGSGDFWEKTTMGWKDKHRVLPPHEKLEGDRTILRIGPAADDAHPMNCSCPDCEPDERSVSDLAIRFQEIENRLDAIEARYRVEKEYEARNQPETPDSSTPTPDVEHTDDCECWICEPPDTPLLVARACNRIDAMESRLKKLEATSTPDVVTDKPPPPDICDEWAKQFSGTPHESWADILRRLGLPEMKAVMGAARQLVWCQNKESEHKWWVELVDVLSALDAKEKANGKTA